MAVISEISRHRDEYGKEKGIAASGQAAVSYREILAGVYLIYEVVFKRGKGFYPDEARANYLISLFACGKTVLWPKSSDFLEAEELFIGTELPKDSAALLAQEAGLDFDSYVWYAIETVAPWQIYRDHCY
jgi:hypothetical protein